MSLPTERRRLSCVIPTGEPGIFPRQPLCFALLVGCVCFCLTCSLQTCVGAECYLCHQPVAFVPFLSVAATGLCGRTAAGRPTPHQPSQSCELTTCPVVDRQQANRQPAAAGAPGWSALHCSIALLCVPGILAFHWRGPHRHHFPF